MLDRINNPPKYKRLEAIRLKKESIRSRDGLQNTLIRMAHQVIGQVYKTPGEVVKGIDFPPIRKVKNITPSVESELNKIGLKELTEDTSVNFLCEMAITDHNHFRYFALILLGQFKNSSLATQTLYHVFEDVDEWARPSALEGIGVTGDMLTLRKALKDYEYNNDEYRIRLTAARFIAWARDANSVDAPFV